MFIMIFIIVYLLPLLLLIIVKMLTNVTIFEHMFLLISGLIPIIFLALPNLISIIENKLWKKEKLKIFDYQSMYEEIFNVDNNGEKKDPFKNLKQLKANILTYCNNSLDELRLLKSYLNTIKEDKLPEKTLTIFITIFIGLMLFTLRSDIDLLGIFNISDSLQNVSKEALKGYNGLLVVTTTISLIGITVQDTYKGNRKINLLLEVIEICYEEFIDEKNK